MISKIKNHFNCVRFWMLNLLFERTAAHYCRARIMRCITLVYKNNQSTDEMCQKRVNVQRCQSIRTAVRCYCDNDGKRHRMLEKQSAWERERVCVCASQRVREREKESETNSGTNSLCDKKESNALCVSVLTFYSFQRRTAIRALITMYYKINNNIYIKPTSHQTDSTTKRMYEKIMIVSGRFIYSFYSATCGCGNYIFSISF